MSTHTLVVTTSLTATEVAAILAQTGGDAGTLLRYLSDWQRGNDGNRIGQTASATAYVGAVAATATMTSTGAAVNDETCVICGVTFTAKTSGATGNQFNLSGTVATQATNIAAAVNASTDLTGVCTATSALGVVTFTAAVPGKIGNGLTLTESLTNVTISSFTSGAVGSNGTISTYLNL